MEYYSVLKRKENLTHATTCMNLEDIMLSKPVTKRQILYNSNYMRYLDYSNLETERRMVAARGRRGK